MFGPVWFDISKILGHVNFNIRSQNQNFVITSGTSRLACLLWQYILMMLAADRINFRSALYTSLLYCVTVSHIPFKKLVLNYARRHVFPSIFLNNCRMSIYDEPLPFSCNCEVVVLREPNSISPCVNLQWRGSRKALCTKLVNSFCIYFCQPLATQSDSSSVNRDVCDWIVKQQVSAKHSKVNIPSHAADPSH